MKVPGKLSETLLNIENTLSEIRDLIAERKGATGEESWIDAFDVKAIYNISKSTSSGLSLPQGDLNPFLEKKDSVRLCTNYFIAS